MCDHSLLLNLSNEDTSAGLVTKKKKKKRHSLEAGMHYNQSPSLSSYPLLKICDITEGAGIHFMCDHSLLLDLSNEGTSASLVTKKKKKKKRHSPEAGMHYNKSPSLCCLILLL